MKVIISVSAAIMLMLLSACKKSNDDTRQPELTDPAKYYFISTTDDNPSPITGSSTSLNAYNPDLTLKWRKQNMAGGALTAFLVDKEVVYAVIQYNIYALNSATGAEIWSKLQTQEQIYRIVKKEDTLYCSTVANTSGAISITAYRASTGALVWRKPLNTQFATTYLTVDGNTLYYTAPTSVFNNSLFAMDLATQNIKWSTPIGAIGWVYSRIIFSENKLFLKTSDGKLLAIDKTNGNILWNKTGLSSDNPVLTANNSTIVSASSSQQSVFGFDANNGNQLWVQYPDPRNGLAAIYISDDGDNFYMAGGDTVECVMKLDAKTGNKIWRQNFKNNMLRYPITVGNKTFLLKVSSNVNYGHTIMSFDASTGDFKDSLRLPYRFAGIPSVISVSGKYFNPY